MKNQETIKYATLHFAIDDLQLLEKALYTLELKYCIDSNKKDDINRLIGQIKQAINPEIYSDTDNL